MRELLAIIVMLNAKPIEFKDAKPLLYQEKVVVPMRETLEYLGARVHYNKAFKTIEISNGTGTGYFGAHGKNVSEDDPSFKQVIEANVDDILEPVKIRGRLYLPLRVIAEAMDAKVNWNSVTRTANITMSEQPSTPEAKPPAIKAGAIEVRVASEKNSYRAGEPVKFTITVINQDDQPRTLNFRSSQSFGISVTPANQNEVLWRWDWSHDRISIQVLRDRTLKPGETLTFSAIWKQTDNEGKPMPRGEYSVQAKLTTEKPVLSAVTIIKLAE